MGTPAGRPQAPRPAWALLALALSVLPAGVSQAVCPSGGGRSGRPGSGGSTPGGPTTPEGGSSGGTETLDDRTWAAWWALSGMPSARPARPVGGGAPTTPAEGRYAAGRDPGLEAAVDALIAGLSDPDDYVRAGAARCLGAIDPPYRRPDAVAGLRKLSASDPDREAREAAGLGLAYRGETGVVDPLRKVLGDAQAHMVTRGFAALSLIRLGDPKGIEKAVDLTTDAREPDLAGAILVGLGATRDTKFLTPLCAAAARHVDGSAAARLRRLRSDAITALGKLGDAAAIPILASLVTDPERAVARSAAIALGGFPGDAHAFDALVQRGVASPEPWVRAFSAVSLARVGRPEALPILGRLAREDEHVGVRPFALLALGLLGDPTAKHLLDEALSAPRRDGTFAAAALAAGLLGASALEGKVAAAIGDGDSFVEGYACMGLGLMGATGRRDALRAHLGISDARIQVGAVLGLGWLDAPGTADWLARQLRTATVTHRQLPLVDSLGLVGTMAEADDLRDAAAANASASLVRVRAFYAMARVLAEHRPSWATLLLAHTYVLSDNVVLAHVGAFP